MRKAGLSFHVAEYMAERLFPIIVTAAEEEIVIISDDTLSLYLLFRRAINTSL